MAPPAYYTDGFFSFEGGLNTGINPLLLGRNQLAEANNCTIRGTFVTNRPGIRQIPLTFSGGIQTVVESGLFQGGCFYNSDFGVSSVFASISGRQFLFNLSDSTATVTEITIPNDQSPATQSQAWAWQSENYIICNDGVSLPFIYDGVTSRRSLGESVVLGVTSVTFTAPSQGSTVNVTLQNPFTGAFGDSVIIGDVVYQVQSFATNNQVTLTNLNDTGTSSPVGTQVISNPKNIAVTVGSLILGAGTYPAGFQAANNLAISQSFTGAIGSVITISGIQFTVTAGGANALSFKFTNATTIGAMNIPPGTIIRYFNNVGPTVLVGTLAVQMTTPAVNASTVVTFTLPYTGPTQIVDVGSFQYTITAIAPVTPGTSIILENVTDIAGSVHTAPVNLESIPELPAGRMGVYGMGRNWLCLPDGISFLAGDIVGGSSGSAVTQGRDAVLKISENSYLNGGGVFRVPGKVGDIRAMRFATTLDSSLGQGPLQVFSPTTVFSVNTPVDRTTWQDTTNPILTESLIGNGALGHNSTVAANGDTFMRSIDGLRSLILARRDFATWGNVPISHEVNPILSQDNKALLAYGSAIVFDNRLLFTAEPTSSAQGVYHSTAVALNFDPISSLGKKSPPVYDGFWDGINVLQYITGLYNGVQRAFAFVLNVNKIELWEILSTDAATDDSGTRIRWDFVTGSLFKDLDIKGPFDFCQLADGELFVDNVLGTVNFDVSYKPDEYSDWVEWNSWSITNDTTVPRSFPRMGFGEPSSDDFNPATKKLLRYGYTFQIKVEVSGHCRIVGARLKATPEAQPFFAKPVCN